MNLKHLLLASAFGVALAAPAYAHITFTLGNHPQPDEQNILFGASEPGEVDHSGVPHLRQHAARIAQHIGLRGFPVGL